jgi:hypothetical protein
MKIRSFTGAVDGKVHAAIQPETRDHLTLTKNSDSSIWTCLGRKVVLKLHSPLVANVQRYDGKDRYGKPKEVGQSERIELDVKGVLRVAALVGWLECPNDSI